MISAQWWNEPKNQAHRQLASTAQNVRDADKARVNKDMRHMRLYSGRNLAGMSQTDYFVERASTANDSLTFNIVQSMIDSVQAKLGKNKPVPQFLTDGADWSMQQRAKKLTRFVEGVFYREDVYRKGQRVLLDAEIFGTSAMHVYREGNAIKVERVMPWELHVDPLEALYGDPRTLYRAKYVDRRVLQSLFPKRAKEIERQGATADKGTPGRDTNSDQVVVFEAWHLPSGPDAGDGRHVIAIGEATLYDEEWTRDRFPFAFMRWAELPIGFWGQGIAERLTGLQFEINTLLQDVQERFHIGSKVWMLLPRGAKVVKSHLVNENGSCIEYSGDVPPQLVTFQTVHPELFQQIERLYQRGYEIIGVSQLSASSQKPAGLNSGKALREYNDIESERFIIDGQAYESMFMELAKLVIDEAREMYANEDADLEVLGRVKSRRRSFVERIKWSEVNLEDDSYEMKVFPMSALPSTPSGRSATVEGWIQAGFIDKTQAMALLDFPDLDNAMSLDLAAYEIVLDAIERMIDEAEFVSPEPYQDLNLAMKLGQGAYLRAKLDRVPDDRLQLLRDYIDACAALLAPPEAPAPAMPPGAPPGPQPGAEQVPPPAMAAA